MAAAAAAATDDDDNDAVVADEWHYLAASAVNVVVSNEDDGLDTLQDVERRRDRGRANSDDRVRALPGLLGGADDEEEMGGESRGTVPVRFDAGTSQQPQAAKACESKQITNKTTTAAI